MVARALTAVRHNLVAWLALFVALGGTSLAASHYVITSTKQIKPSVLKALEGRTGARGPMGPQGPAGARGESGSKGESGARGETGASGGPVAYAHVLRDGQLDLANSKNVTASSEFEPGVYCLNVTVPVHVGVASVDANESEGSASVELGEGPALECGKAGNAKVITSDGKGPALEGFYAAFN